MVTAFEGRQRSERVEGLGRYQDEEHQDEEQGGAGLRGERRGAGSPHPDDTCRQQQFDPMVTAFEGRQRSERVEGLGRYQDEEHQDEEQGGAGL